MNQSPDPSEVAIGLFDLVGTNLEAREALVELVHALSPVGDPARGAVESNLLGSSRDTASAAVDQASREWTILADPHGDASEIARLVGQVHGWLQPGGSLAVVTTVLPGAGSSDWPAGLSHWEMVRILLEQAFVVRQDLRLSTEALGSYRRLLQRIGGGRSARPPQGGSADGAMRAANRSANRPANGSKLEDIELHPEVELRLLLAVRDEYRVLPYCEGDEAEILDLFHRSFHVERSMGDWRWKYRDNPYGNLRLSAGRDPDGRLVSHYAAYPVRLFRSRDQGDPQDPVLIHQVGDTMTAASVRRVGRGVSTLLARSVRHFYATFCHGQVAFNYGFNTSKIHRFSLRLAGAEKVEDVPYRRLDLEPKDLDLEPKESAAGSLARWRPRSRETNDGTRYRVERIAQADPRFDDFYLETRDHYRALVERDARYLQWRYLDRPGVSYRLYAVLAGERLAGWGVFLSRGDELVWGDALFDPAHTEAVAELLETADRDGAGCGHQSITGWFPPRPMWWHRCLEALGFQSQPEPQSLAMVAVPFLDPAPAAWLSRDLYYTYGDSDLF